MGNTYKDREQRGLPRVPKWARPKPQIAHTNTKDKRRKQKDDLDDREQWLETLYDNSSDS